MYNAHRGLVPGAPNNRLNELLDQVRAEFENEAGRSVDYENRINQQVQEMDMIRREVYQLEQSYNQVKMKYEEDVARLRHELEARGGPPQQPHGNAPQLGGPAQPPPPSIGHGPSNLFGSIMAGGQSGGPNLAPPPPPPQEQQQSQGLPPNVPQGPQGLNPPPGPPPAAPFYQQPQGVNGYPQTTASPGGSSNRPGPRPPPGQATPQPNPAAPYPGSPKKTYTNVGNTLADLDPDQLSDAYKREGPDWYAVFNPRARRILDVSLVHTLPHQSVVCCVRFSHDGRLVATGCNRSAQIFDVESGALVHHLQDASLPEDGDLYIRSVCFSPDGRYLATGAEDKVIRVWDIHTRQIKHQFTGHDQDIYSLDFARNGRLIASGSGDRTVRLWDIETNQQVLQLTIEDGVTTVAISPDNRFVAAGSLDKSVRVWDTQSGLLVERLEGDFGHKDSVYSVAFAPNGRELVSGSLDKTIKMWELNPNSGLLQRGGGSNRGGKCVRTFEGHKDFVLSVALTPDGQWVLSGSKDRGVQFWDPMTGVAQLMLQGHKNSVISVAPSPTGTLFATGSGDMRARIWSYEQYRGPPAPQ